jgi:hypothetical protein
VFLCSLLAYCGYFSNVAYAEDIRIPIGQQAADKNTLELPQTGMSKARVLDLFGEPIAQKAARGTPPISQWQYNEFVVYFEYDHVIHSVKKFTPNKLHQTP